MKSLVIVEDDKRFSIVLRKMLQQYGFSIDAFFYNANDFLEYIKKTKKYPDLCLFDLELPDKSGVQIIKEIQDYLSFFNVLILTSFSDEDKVFEAIKSGASGYILKRDLPLKLKDSVIEAIDGGVVIEPILANKFFHYFQTFKTTNSQTNIDLTIDENELLQYLIKGFTYKEIAKFTNKTPRNVKYTLTKIYKKLGVKSKVEAISEAIKLGLLDI